MPSLSVILRLIFVISATTAQGTPSIKKYVAEVYIVFDEYALAKYHHIAKGAEEMFHDAAFYLTFVNQLYKTMNQYGLDIEIRIVRMEIAEEGILLDKGAHPVTVSSKGLLNKFVQWQNAENTKERLNYDLAILYTGLEMKMGSETMTGIATIGTICKYRQSYPPSAIISFHSFDSASTTAHELGHIFGAQHDGKASFNVMGAAHSYDRSERFNFSRCSAVDILENLRIREDKCLLETSPMSTLPDTAGEHYRGQLRNPHFLCRVRFGKDARVCSTFKIPPVAGDPGDPNCLRFYCSRTLTGKCEGLQTPEGMPCDKDKICKVGRCVPDTSGLGFAKDTIPGCIFGDERLIFTYGSAMTCEDAYASRGGPVCLDVRDNKCCATCKKQEIATNIPGCYGDATKTAISGYGHLDCTTMMAKFDPQWLCSHNILSKRCCKTCKDK